MSLVHSSMCIQHYFFVAMPTVRITVLTKMYVKWCFIQIAKLLSERLHNLLTALLNRVGAVSDGPFFFQLSLYHTNVAYYKCCFLN